MLAVTMVVAAFLVRGQADDEQDAATTGSGEDGVLCPDDLAQICAAAGGARSEAAGATADRLIGAVDPGDLDAGAWVIPSAWARLVVAERERLGREPIFEVAGGPLASSPVVLAIWADRAEALGEGCGRPVDWRCIAGQAAGTQVHPGGEPVDSATGLAVAAAQAGALLGRPDYAANDFDPEFTSLAARLAAGQTRDPLATMRLRGPGQLTAVGTVGARTASLSSTFGEIVVLRDRPAARADVVALVPAGTELDGDVRRDLTEAFRAAGWDPPAGGPDGLPTDGSVLAAVRTQWTENR